MSAGRSSGGFLMQRRRRGSSRRSGSRPMHARAAVAVEAASTSGAGVGGSRKPIPGLGHRAATGLHSLAAPFARNATAFRRAALVGRARGGSPSTRKALSPDRISSSRQELRARRLAGRSLGYPVHWPLLRYGGRLREGAGLPLSSKAVGDSRSGSSPQLVHRRAWSSQLRMRLRHWTAPGVLVGQGVRERGP
jgi:hypothetical protein